jgi:hypothetical protein
MVPLFFLLVLSHLIMIETASIATTRYAASRRHGQAFDRQATVGAALLLPSDRRQQL